MSFTGNTEFSRRGFVAAAGAACASAALAGCSSDEATESAGSEPVLEDAPKEESEPKESAAQKLLESMTLEQKVAQLFFVTPEVLTGVGVVTAAGETTAKALEAMPVGGLIYFSENITGADQLEEMLTNTMEYSRNAGAGVPVFTGVDEEGGTLVARVANSGYFDVEKFSNMADIGATGDATKAAYVGTSIGSYLHEIGFNVDFAPDADVLTNPENTVIGARSFSSDPDVVAEMVSAEIEAMLQTGTLPCAKHFPGHGDTAGDSHTGEAISERTMDQLNECEFKPFQAAAQAGCPFIMVGHIKTPNAAADDLPATLSSKMITDILRNQLGYTGVIISDSMRMGAITEFYSQADATVKFLQAGGDMVLMPDDLEAAYQGVLDAVSAGTITEDRINESVSRVIAAKQAAGLVEK